MRSIARLLLAQRVCLSVWVNGWMDGWMSRAGSVSKRLNVS